MSPDDTESIGQICGERSPPGTIILLDGKIAAGKTCFARGFARGLGVETRISSPTYPIIMSHSGKQLLHHMDWYRLGGDSDAYELGLEEYFDGSALCLIEWSEKMPASVPRKHWKIDFKLEDQTSRFLTFSHIDEPLGPHLFLALGAYVYKGNLNDNTSL